MFKKNKRTGYLTVDMCLCLIILAIMTYVVSIFISNIHSQYSHIKVQNNTDYILRKELDYTVSTLRRAEPNLYLSQDLSVYSRYGYTFEKKYTLLNEDFKLYRIDLAIRSSTPRYRLATYLVLADK